MAERWLSVDEIADYLGVKRDTLYKWIKRRALPAHKVGRLWKFQRDEIDLWVRDGSANNDGVRRHSRAPRKHNHMNEEP
ncbi:MAG: helix-turn-helix domain-containing protein [Terracidiphilus sp.]